MLPNNGFSRWYPSRTNLTSSGVVFIDTFENKDYANQLKIDFLTRPLRPLLDARPTTQKQANSLADVYYNSDRW